MLFQLIRLSDLFLDELKSKQKIGLFNLGMDEVQFNFSPYLKQTSWRLNAHKKNSQQLVDAMHLDLLYSLPTTKLQDKNLQTVTRNLDNARC